MQKQSIVAFFSSVCKQTPEAHKFQFSLDAMLIVRHFEEQFYDDCGLFWSVSHVDDKRRSLSLQSEPDCLSIRFTHDFINAAIFVCSFWEPESEPLPHQPEVHRRADEAAQHVPADDNVPRQCCSGFE